jgi:hypothetical protein
MTQRRGPFLRMSSSQAKNFALPTLLPKRSDFFSSLLAVIMQRAANSGSACGVFG